MKTRTELQNFFISFYAKYKKYLTKYPMTGVTTNESRITFLYVNELVEGKKKIAYLLKATFFENRVVIYSKYYEQDNLPRPYDALSRSYHSDPGIQVDHHSFYPQEETHHRFNLVLPKKIFVLSLARQLLLTTLDQYAKTDPKLKKLCLPENKDELSIDGNAVFDFLIEGQRQKVVLTHSMFSPSFSFQVEPQEEKRQHPQVKNPVVLKLSSGCAIQ